MSRVTRLVAIGLAALAIAGCGLLYTDVRAPRAYRSATPADVKAQASDPTVTGEACYQSLLFLVAWGDASYAAATRAALAAHPDGILYDVKADMKATSVALGAYARVCTIVTGKVSRR